MDLVCNSEEGKIKWIHKPDDPCAITVEWKHPSGCPIIRVNALWNFFDKYRVYLAPSLILGGLFFLVFGGYFIKTSLFIITFSTVLFFITAILYAFIISYNAETWVGWIVLPVSTIIGFIIAYFTSAFMRIGVILIGLWAGATVGAMVYQSVGYLITSKVGMLWSLMGVLAIISSILAIKFYRLVMIIGTSIVGAFLLMRGIGIYSGGYPNEFELHNEIVSGTMKFVPWTVYVYILGVIVSAGLSVLWKLKILKFPGGSKLNERYFDINN